MRIIIISVSFLLGLRTVYGQGCCSGGSGSPIAGGVSQGVLLDRQMEIASSFQYINGNKFKTKDKDTVSLFDNFNSKYIYSKIAYGVTKDFTFSVESGYYINKTQIGLRDSLTGVPIDSLSSSGIGDLILFPRYTVYNYTGEKQRRELTLGLGYKIPIGKHDDSSVVFVNTFTGQKVYAIMPPLVQPTTGSNDFILYSFFYWGFPQQKFRVFTNALYIRKGWNSLGYKYGDYASAGLFVGKTFFDKLGITMQLKGEWVDSMRHVKEIDMVAMYNIYVSSTGSKKLLFVPQVSLSYKNFTVFGLSEFPLYEYVNGVQIASQRNIILGMSYKFFTVRSKIPQDD